MIECKGPAEKSSTKDVSKERAIQFCPTPVYPTQVYCTGLPLNSLLHRVIIWRAHTGLLDRQKVKIL